MRVDVRSASMEISVRSDSIVGWSGRVMRMDPFCYDFYDCFHWPFRPLLRYKNIHLYIQTQAGRQTNSCHVTVWVHFRSAHRDRSLVILLLLALVLCVRCPSLQILEIVRESPPWPLAISLLRFSSDHRSVNRVNSSGSNSGSRPFSRSLLATEPKQAVHGAPHFVMPPTSRSRDGGPPERCSPRIAVFIYSM